MAPRELILSWLQSRLGPEAMEWLRAKALVISVRGGSAFNFFSSAIRYSGKAPLDLPAGELESAAAAVEGWNPRDWTLDQAARIHLLLSLPAAP